MFDILKKELDEFINSAETTSRAEYITLYKYFVEYLEIKYPIYNYPNIKAFLSEQLSRFDIVNSCVYYLEKSKARSVTAIAKYLGAMTFLYNSYFLPNDCGNKNLHELIPFSGLKDEVKEGLANKKLQEKAAIPVLTTTEFINICKFMEKDKRRSYVKNGTYIIWKLLLLYGFKFERIKYLETKNYNSINRTLKIHVDENETITIKLPDALALEMSEYISQGNRKRGYIFVNTKGKVITSAFIDYPFRQLMEKHGMQGKPNAFNATGLAKYAINSMLEVGLDAYNIRKITGMENIVIDYCQDLFYKKTKDLRDINSFLELIPTAGLLYKASSDN